MTKEERRLPWKRLRRAPRPPAAPELPLDCSAPTSKSKSAAGIIDAEVVVKSGGSRELLSCCLEKRPAESSIINKLGGDGDC